MRRTSIQVLTREVNLRSKSIDEVTWVLSVYLRETWGFVYDRRLSVRRVEM